MDRLQAVLQALNNDKTKLVIDLSCRRKDDKWFVATNKWQTITNFELNQGTCTHPPNLFATTLEQQLTTTRRIDIPP
jgi:phosphoribosylformimino-5-aminoimidazole carboxamide ribonucleotide (ProFAR) isomerase